MKRPQFAEGELYHIFNRGVEKRNIFMTDGDRFRFIYNLYEFNDTAPAQNIFYKRSAFNAYEVGLRKSKKSLVEILAFVLMPNHYHLMLRQLVEGGVTEFMRKLGTGYTNFFNLKYDRVGSLFQGKFKAVLLKHEAKAMRFLKSYRWSSLLDYLGNKNLPQIIEQQFLTECIGGPKEFLSRTRENMKHNN